MTDNDKQGIWQTIIGLEAVCFSMKKRGDDDYKTIQTWTDNARKELTALETALADAVRERDEARGYVQRISNMTGFRCTNEDCPAVQAHIYINGLSAERLHEIDRLTSLVQRLAELAREFIDDEVGCTARQYNEVNNSPCSTCPNRKLCQIIAEAGVPDETEGEKNES